jgi:hypothetical protein
MIVRDDRGEQYVAVVDERAAPVLAVLLPGDRVELAWAGDRVIAISRRAQPASSPQTGAGSTAAVTEKSSGPTTAVPEHPSRPTTAATEKPAAGPKGKQTVRMDEPAGGTTVAAVPASTAATTRTATKPRLIQVIADKDNRFKVPGESKPVLKVKSGEKVLLRITSHFGGEKARDDAVHSFAVKKLRDQGWDIRLYEGTRDYPLVAPLSPGEYEVECTVKCGPGHDDMKMRLVVQS